MHLSEAVYWSQEGSKPLKKEIGEKTPVKLLHSLIKVLHFPNKLHFSEKKCSPIKYLHSLAEVLDSPEKRLLNICILLQTLVKSNIFKIHLFHNKDSSNLLIYLLTYNSRLTDRKIIITIYLEYIYMHSAHFLILSLKCVLMSLFYDLWIISVYLKYTCNSSTSAQSNILQYIFSWTSALLHN